MASMFSIEEMRELALAFPNSYISAFPTDQQGVRLIPSLSGDGFIRSDIFLQTLDETIEAEGQGRLPLSHLAASFDIEKDVLASLVKDPPSELLLSTDGQNVVSRAEAERLQEDLKELVEGRVVYAAGVAIANNLALDSIHKLVSMNRYGAKGEDEDAPRLALHPETRDAKEMRQAIIFSPSYLEWLVEDAQSAFEQAQEAGEMESVPQDAVLPTPFLQLIVDRLGDGFDGRFVTTEGTVDFTPTVCLERQRDEKLQGLADGTVAHCSLQWLVDLLPEQYPDLSAAERYIHANHSDDVLILVDTAVSKLWHDEATSELLQTYRDKLLVNVSDPFEDLSPDAAREAAAKSHTDILATVRADSTLPDTISEGLFPYLIRIDLFATIQETFTSTIRTHAHDLWNQPPTSDPDLVLGDLATILSPAATSLDLPSPLLPILLRCSCDGAAKQTFAATLADLEAASDAALAAAWRDRVVVRTDLYAAGAAAVPDPKLRTQLAEVLRAYLSAELVPEAVARMESKGLVRTARAKRNVKKLLAALQEQQKDQQPQSDDAGLGAALGSLRKFAAKMDVGAGDEGTAAERKEAVVRGMVEGMRRDGDAPRLFLTLVVVLWARRAEGVVYATGKMAPKVLRLLKGGEVGEGEEEAMARLEALKESVKAGTVGDEDKEEMRKMAAEAWAV